MENDWLNTSLDLKGKRIWIAGHAGMVGSALMRRLSSEECHILTASRDEVDLRRQDLVEGWVKAHRPDMIVITAAKVGGILANERAPADFLYDNLMIESNIIHAAFQAKVKKLLFLGSSCIYPKEAPQPLTEDALLSGALEPTNEAYAIAKIAGIKLCQAYRAQHGCDFISAMPCNLYGPGDRFDAQNSHVIPALIMKAHDAVTTQAKTLDIWGSGKPLREFLHVDDLADGLVFLLKHYSALSPINIGSGEEISIHGLAQMIADITGFQGKLVFDQSKPDGTLRKIMDNSRIKNAGWDTEISLKEGLSQTYADYADALIDLLSKNAAPPL